MVGVQETAEIQLAPDSAIPITILLDRNISVLEAIAEYLKEERGLSYAEIGRLTNRDERNIWTAYHRAKEKREHRTPTPTTNVFFPLSAGQDRKLSIFEAIVIHLRDRGVSNNDLAAATNRSAKTISTVYVRAKRK